MSNHESLGFWFLVQATVILRYSSLVIVPGVVVVVDDDVEVVVVVYFVVGVDFVVVGARGGSVEGVSAHAGPGAARVGSQSCFVHPLSWPSPPATCHHGALPSCHQSEGCGPAGSSRGGPGICRREGSREGGEGRGRDSEAGGSCGGEERYSEAATAG